MINTLNSYPKRVIIILIFFFNISHATCIIGIFYNDTLYIGFDSRLTIITYSTGDTTYSTTNKIHKVGSLYFLTAGISAINNFYPNTIIKESLINSRDFIESIDSAKTNIFIKYNSFVTDLYSTDRNKFNLILRIKKFGLNFILIGIHENRPRFYLYYIDVIAAGIDSFEVKYRSNYYPIVKTDNFGKFIIMDNIATNKFMIDNPSYNFSINPVESIKKLLSYGIKYDCSCGEPIKILRITKDGYSWIE